MIDIRSDHDREHDGIVPGSLRIPRTVPEWRLEPTNTRLEPTNNWGVIIQGRVMPA